MEQSEWPNDWFMSHSPRSGNGNAEGPWDHWVDFAIRILQHPATGLVRPDAHAAVQGVPALGFYSETGRALTEGECSQLFEATS